MPIKGLETCLESTMPKHNVRCRFWCFTLNNPDGLVSIEEFQGYARYLIYSEEIGEEGTLHLQGYVEMRTQKSMLAMKKYLPRAHWYRRRGNQEQAIEYCSKSDSHIGGPYIFGVPSPEERSRTDLVRLHEDIKKGMSEKDISDKYFTQYLRYHKGIQAYMQLHAPKKHWICPIEVVVGEAGAGKSYYVQNNLLKDKQQYWKDGTRWWPFYEGTEEAIIFDEFVGCYSPYELNRMYDPVPFAVEVKGSHRPFVAKKIVIISNYHPASWWSKVEYWPAFQRRVSNWHYCFKRPGGGNQVVYERQSFTEWDKFKDKIDTCGVPSKPSKEDK